MTERSETGTPARAAAPAGPADALGPGHLARCRILAPRSWSWCRGRCCSRSPTSATRSWPQMAYYAIAAGGLTVLTGLNGQISLGHGALMAVGAYTTALFLQPTSDAPLPLILLVSPRCARPCRRRPGRRRRGPPARPVPGRCDARPRGRPARSGALLRGHPRRRAGPAGPCAPGPRGFDRRFIDFVSGNAPTGTKCRPTSAWLTLIVTFFLLANLVRSRIGRTWRAVRDQEVAAELAGINLGGARVLAFVVSAAAAGPAGGVLALVVRLAAPSGFTLVLSPALLTAIVLGGLGSLLGALLGSALLVVPAAVRHRPRRRLRARQHRGRPARAVRLRRRPDRGR